MVEKVDNFREWISSDEAKRIFTLIVTDLGTATAVALTVATRNEMTSVFFGTLSTFTPIAGILLYNSILMKNQVNDTDPGMFGP